jgi:hypothetical protein
MSEMNFARIVRELWRVFLHDGSSGKAWPDWRVIGSSKCEGSKVFSFIPAKNDFLRANFFGSIPPNKTEVFPR